MSPSLSYVDPYYPAIQETLESVFDQTSATTPYTDCLFRRSGRLDYRIRSLGPLFSARGSPRFALSAGKEVNVTVDLILNTAI